MKKFNYYNKDADLLKFVIAGTGRSGSGYISRVLDLCGLSCGHENVFNPGMYTSGGRHSLLGDSSWLVVPWLRSLPNAVIVFNQVRHPLDFINSMASDPYLFPYPVNEYANYRKYWVDRFLLDRSIEIPNNQLDYYAATWWVWASEAQVYSICTWRIEQISEEIIQHILDKVGHTIPSQDPDRIKWALETALENKNEHRFGRPPKYSIEDLRGSKFFFPVNNLAEELGYGRL